MMIKFLNFCFDMIVITLSFDFTYLIVILIISLIAVRKVTDILVDN